MASSSDEGATRKRKHEQHNGCSMPNTIPLDVDKDAVTIGRLKDAAVQLQCSLIPSMISRKHATIVHSRLKRKWFIKDHKSCNGVYINETRIDADKWVEVKVKDQLCFGTPISNNSFRYVLEQLTNEDYQLVQEEFIAEEELSGGIKKKPSEMGVTDTSETGAVNSEKEEPTRNYNNKANPDEVAVSTSSIVDGTKRYEMLSSMQEEFLCVICQELFVKAHSLSCSHSYCEKCINDWMKKGNKYCPMCRKAIEGKPVPSIAMDNAIDKLVKCLSEEAQKERAELLEERKPSKKEVILISDSPVRPGSSVITRSVSRRNNPVHLVSSDSDSDSSELSSSEDDDDEPEQHEGFDYGDDSIDDELEGYTGLPGHSWGGYGHCYRCGDPGHWAPGCPHR